MKKRIFSGLLAVLMLFSTAVAVNDTATAAADAITFALKPVTGSDYDSSALTADLSAAQSTLAQRMQLEGLSGASSAVNSGVITVTIPKSATSSTAAFWAARLGDRRLCSVTDFLNEEWKFDRADFASAKAATENGEEAVQIDLTDSGKTKLTEAHAKVKAYLADSKYNADQAQWLTFHWGTTTFRMLVDDTFSDSSLIIGGDSDPLRAGASSYLPKYLMLDPLPFAMQQTDVPAATKPTTPTQPTTPTEPTEPAAPTEPTTPDTPAATDFPDINGHWAANELRKGVDLGLLKGINGKIMPNNSVKRSEAVVILNRALGAAVQDSVSGLAANQQNAWYSADLGKAIHLGLIDKADNRNFDTAATRAEAFVLMARGFVYDRAESAADELSGFTDTSSMTAEQKQAAAALIAKGIVNGTGTNKLSPSGKLTRAQFVTMIVRIASAVNNDSNPTELAGGTVLTAADISMVGNVADGDLVFAAATNNISLDAVSSAHRVVLKGEESAVLNAKNNTSLSTLAVDPAGTADVKLESGSSVQTLVIAGKGGAVSVNGAAANAEITASNRTINLEGMTADSITITGSGNTILLKSDATTVSVIGGMNNRITVSGTVGTMVLAGRNTTVDGSGKIGTVDTRSIGCTVTASAEHTIDNVDPGLSGVQIHMTVPAKVTAGGSLTTKVSFSGVPEGVTCKAIWYQDGTPIKGCTNENFELTNETTSSHLSTFTFTKNMKTTVTMGFKLMYDNPSTGLTEQVTAEKTVPIENYSAEWYAQRDAAAILKQVSSVYRGNYTTSYAAKNDYSTTTKEVWINAKGYSSNTNYLVWINRAYQHVNVFTGSKGNWKLVKSFIVGTGAADTPTPVGVTTVTYKLKAGWTTGTYTVRPVVGFYPNTGYAFHSRLCYPGTDTEYDFSSGYPVSHGCVRMQHNDINWIYNNVPIGSTVVIF